MADLKLSEHFSREEFACHGEDCCYHSAPVHPDLIDALEKLRAIVNKPLHIVSGFRCRKHNEAVGGEPNSMHCLAIAADVSIPEGMTAEDFGNKAAEVPAFLNGGIGLYDTWIHVDVRPWIARWDKRMVLA
jgi:uncharacterized protein YcbK (DUF882 family)